jgi:membrane-associated phospholipid phosphatase
LNLKGLFSRQNLWPLLIGAGANAAATAFDDPVKDFFYGHERLEEMGEVGSIIGNRFVVAGITGGLLISGYLSQDTRHRSMLFTLAQGYAVTISVTAAVKVTTRRLRPNGENRVSFLSGHTSTVFTWAMVLDHYYGRKVAIPAYLVATFVGISRMESSHHSLSDVVAGAALGYIVGRTVIRGTQPLKQKRRLTWPPMITPDNVGLSLAVSF